MEELESIYKPITMRRRYEIGDSDCGVIGTTSSLKAALQEAAAHSCKDVEIFDRLARYDCAQTWDARGTILTFKKRGI